MKIPRQHSSFILGMLLSFTRKMMLVCLATATPLFAQTESNTPIFADSIYPHQKRPIQLSINQERELKELLYRAVIAENTDRDSDAFDYLNLCLEIDSTNATVLTQMALHSLRRDLPDQAYLYAKRAVSYSPQSESCNLTYLQASVLSQNYESAIAALQKIMQINPSRAPYLYETLAELYVSTNQIQKAIETLHEAEKIRGFSIQSFSRLTSLYILQKKPQEAIRITAEKIKQQPDNIPIYHLLSSIYHHLGNYEDAINTLLEAKEEHPQDIEIRETIAQLYTLIKDYPNAISTLQQAINEPHIEVNEKSQLLISLFQTTQSFAPEQSNSVLSQIDSLYKAYPNEHWLLLMRGNFLLDLDVLSEAEKNLEAYTAIKPSDANGWRLLLRIMSNDDIDKYIKTCLQAIKADPSSWMFRISLGQAYAENNQNKLALEAFRVSTPLATNKEESSYSSLFIADIYNKENNIDSAIHYYEKAISLAPNDIAINNYCYFLAKEQIELDRAEKMGAELIKKHPNDATFLDTYGWILYQQKAYTMAKIYLERAVRHSEEKDEPSSEIFEHYGDVLYMTNNKEQAIEYWKKARAASSEENHILNEKIRTESISIQP